MALSSEYQFIGRSGALMSPGGYAYYALLYAKTDPNNAAGSHTVSLKLCLACLVASSFYDWYSAGYARVDGADALAWDMAYKPNKAWSSEALTAGGVTYPRWVDLGEGSTVVSCGFNTEKTVELTWGYEMLDYNSGTWFPQSGVWITGKATAVLPAVAGSTVPVMGASSVELGKPVTIQTSALVTGATHTLRYSIGGASGVIAENVDSSYPWTPSIELARQILNAPSGTAVITCITYRNGAQLGSQQQTTVELIVPADVLPTASATWTDPSGAFDALGVYAKGVSRLSINVAGTGVYGSTITGASVTLDGKAYTGGVISAVGDLELVATVKDSRGRSGSAKYAINVADYATPTLTLNASRCASNGEADDMGEYAKITVTGYVSTVGKNTASLKVEYGSASETVQLTPGNISYSKIVSAPSTSTMKISATLTDALFSAPASMVLSVGYATMDFLEGGKGIAFGTTATQEGFECAMPARFTGGVSGVAPDGYGLGTVAYYAKTLSDANDGTRNGWYRLAADTVNGVGVVAMMRTDAYSEDSLVQTVYSSAYSNSYPLLMRRVKFHGTWQPWEWPDPPMVPGVEYCTTERFMGKPVYTKLLNFGSLPNAAQKNVAHGISDLGHPIHISGTAKSSDWSFSMPIYNSGITEFVFNKQSVIITTTVDWSGYQCYVTLKYTKD